MTRPRPGIGSELLPLSLILASLAATLILVIAMHRRAVVARKPAESAPSVQVVAAPPPVVEEPSQAPEPEPPPPAPPPPPQEDPTKKALARLSAAEAAEHRAAEDADRRADALDTARRAALAESRRIRGRVALIRAQVDNLTAKAQNMEMESEALALERDVLAQERDEAKAALAKARTSSSYAIMPHKGPNGTWRRPVVIECVNGTAKLQPDGPTFTLLDLSSLMGMRASPLVVAVARKIIDLDGAPSPDGAPVVPYIVFVVRPDGIRPYYEARARLEPLGIAFGYELVDQDWEIDFSDPEGPTEGIPSAPHSSGLGSRLAEAGTGGSALNWPGEQTPRRSAGTQDKDTPQSYVWSGRGRGQGNGGGPIAGREGAGGPGAGGRPKLGANGGTGDNPANEGPGGATPGAGLEPRGPAGGSPLQPFPTNRGTGGRSISLLGQPGGGSGLSANPPGGGGSMPGQPGGGSGLSANPPGGGGSMPGQPGGGPGMSANPPGGGSGQPNPPLGGGTGNLTGQSQTGAFGGTRAQSATERAFGQSSGLVPLSPDGIPSLETPGSAEGSPGNLAGGSGNPGGASSSNASSGGGTGGPPSTANSDQVAGLSAPPGGGSSTSSTPPGGIPLTIPAPPGGLTSSSTSPPSAGSNGMGSGSPPPSQTGRIPVMPSDLVADQESGGSSSGASDGALSGKKGDGKSGTKGGRKSSFYQPKRVEVPFEITVACGPSGVLIYPGGYRLSSKALQQEGLLTKELLAILQLRKQVDPLIVPQPSIKFLIEPGGNDQYWKVRKQLLLSKIDWPMSLQLGDTSLLGFAPRETRR